MAHLPTELLSFFAKRSSASGSEKECGVGWSKDDCIHMYYIRLAWGNVSFAQALFQARLQRSSHT